MWVSERRNLEGTPLGGEKGCSKGRQFRLKKKWRRRGKGGFGKKQGKGQIKKKKVVV